jgi:hypothetical protein
VPQSHTKPAPYPSSAGQQEASQVEQTNADLEGVSTMFALSHRKNLALSGASLGVLATLLLAQPAQAQSAPVQLGPVSVNDNADKNGLNHSPPQAFRTRPRRSMSLIPQP